MPIVTGHLRIGCPVWACADWRGSLYTAGAERKDYLPQYASVFSTVEGNSSFYALPSPNAVARWRAETPSSFRFCFKFPSDITHRLMLRNARAETHAFLKLMSPLEERLGPLMLQLGPRFGPQGLDTLRAFLRELPGAWHYAVEVRHPAFFDHGPDEAALNDLLRERGADRVLFDTRCVHAAPAHDRSTGQAQARKPLLPARNTVTGTRPLLRFVGQNDVSQADAYLDEWSELIAQWLQTGLKPYCFTHTPDDRHAPELARMLHDRIRARLPALAPLPAFPGESQRVGQPAAGQLALF